VKKIRARGMRDIPTIQGLRHRSVPGNREQAVAEIARLEHEKARLQRELDIWMGNQERTETRIRQVDERLAALQDMVDPPASSGKRRARAARSAGKEADEDTGQEWREVTLEY
jgi:predicted  nucleic acid-binding Zn-ribbon protein